MRRPSPRFLASKTPLTVRWAIVVLAISLTALAISVYLTFQLTRCSVALQSYDANRTLENRASAISICRIIFTG